VEEDSIIKAGPALDRLSRFDAIRPGAYGCPAVMRDSHITDFSKIRTVIPHKALGLILYLNIEKTVEDFAEQKARKFYIIRFDLT
jgi:hypothetical protein